MGVIYYRLIKLGIKTLDDVPTVQLKLEVEALLERENEATD